ncbi:hypothetical protein B0H13DRAFT_1874509 [Mycena leptocephala]|nr:hypothetical protein B0H13DRAFT_1874509 [Mycena leptocephala]
MGRGRKSQLGADKLAYLESHFPEFQELQPNLGRFWTKVERGWNDKWPVELDLGLPMLSTQGVLIETLVFLWSIRSRWAKLRKKIRRRAALTLEQTIHNWFNNRSQKEKKLLNGSSGTNTFGLKELMANFGGGGKRTRKLHRVELWQKRNPEVLEEALKATEYHNLMGTSDDEETPDERTTRIKTGRSAMLKLQRQVRAEQFEKASEEEKAAVEEAFSQQERRKTGLAMGKAETPEEFQEGLEKLGPLLKTFHGALGELTGWVGGTVMTGPIPNQGGKIGTQSYCHGVTPAGHTLDQAIAGWDDNVVAPLQQFGKKVFDHPTRRARAFQVPESEVALDTGSSGVSGPSDDGAHSHGVGGPEPPKEDRQKRQRKKKSKKKNKQAAEPSAYADTEGAAIPPAASFFDAAPAGRSSAENSAGGDWWNNDDWRAEDSIPAKLTMDPALDMALFASPAVDPAVMGLYTCPTVDPAAEMSYNLSPPATTLRLSPPAMTRPKPRPAHRGSLFGRAADDPADDPAPFELTSLSEESATHSDLSPFVSNFVYQPLTASIDSSSGAAAPRTPVPTPSAPVSPNFGSYFTLPKPATLSMPTHPATALPTHRSPGPVAPAPRSPAVTPSRPSSAAPTPTPQRQASGTPIRQTPIVQTPSTPAPAAVAAPAVGAPTPQCRARGTPAMRTPGVGIRPSSSAVTTPSPLRVVHTVTAASTKSATSPSHPAPLPALTASATPASTSLAHAQAVTMTMTTPAPAPRLSHDNFPESRPMCNPPVGPKPDKPGRGGRGGRRGARGGGRGRGGRGGGARGGGAQAAEGSADAGEGSPHTPVESDAGDGRFLQTYDALGNVVALPLETHIPTLSAAQKRQLLEIGRKHDAGEEKARKAGRSESATGEPSALGSRVRRPSAKVAESEPQRKRTMAEIRAEAAQKKSAKDAPSKRKLDLENELPHPQKRRAQGFSDAAAGQPALLLSSIVVYRRLLPKFAVGAARGQECGGPACAAVENERDKELDVQGGLYKFSASNNRKFNASNNWGAGGTIGAVGAPPIQGPNRRALVGNDPIHAQQTLKPLIVYQEAVRKWRSAAHFGWAVRTATRLFVHRPLRHTTPPPDSLPDAVAELDIVALLLRLEEALNRELV